VTGDERQKLVAMMAAAMSGKQLSTLSNSKFVDPRERTELRARYAAEAVAYARSILAEIEKENA